MRYGICSLLKAVPIVVNVCVIWALVESCLICNYSTSSFLYIMLFNLHCTLWYRMVYNMLITTVAYYRIDNGSCCLEDTDRIFIVRWAFLEIFGLSFLITKYDDFSQIFIKLRMEMGNMSKRQQPDQITDNSRRPSIGLQRGEKIPQPELHGPCC